MTTHFPDEMHLLEAAQSILSKSATTKHDHACSLHTCSSKLVMNTIIIPAKILAKKQLWSELNSLVSTVVCPDRLNEAFGIAMNMQLFVMAGHIVHVLPDHVFRNVNTEQGRPEEADMARLRQGHGSGHCSTRVPVGLRL